MEKCIKERRRRILKKKFKENIEIFEADQILELSKNEDNSGGGAQLINHQLGVQLSRGLAHNRDGSNSVSNPALSDFKENIERCGRKNVFQIVHFIILFFIEITTSDNLEATAIIDHKVSNNHFCDNASNDDLREELRQWAIEENIPHTSINKLLKILRKKLELPIDARTLLKSSHDLIEITITKMNTGEFWYYGISNHLKKIILNSKIDNVQLAINIDGMPLFHNSTRHAWPILGSVDNASDNKPFLIAIWFGEGKPDLNLYLQEFIKELKSLLENGLIIDIKTYKITFRAFICDAPARAYVKQITSHNGYQGCEKCSQNGVYLHKVIFPEIHAPLRTNETFRRRIHEEHHTGTSPLEALNIDMVQSFGIEYMHLICLGVVKKLLTIWCFGNNRSRLSVNQKMNISLRIKCYSRFLPKEFNRRLRDLKHIKQWKATEYRTFLMYLGPSVLENLLPKKNYQHFMLLHVAITILSKKELIGMYDRANYLLEQFVVYFRKIYGDEYITYNIHNLIHLTQDCRTLGPLHSWSAFKYENYLGSLKKLLRSGNKPLQQIAKRTIERNTIPVKKTTINNTSNNSIIKYMYINNLYVSTTPSNNFFKLTDGNICKIVNIENNALFVNIFVLKNYYLFPIKSRHLSIGYIEKRNNQILKINICDIKNKCVTLKLKNNKYVCFEM